MTRMRILITGITGFVGSHLAELALARGADVVGALRWRSNTEHIEPLRERLTLILSDLRDLSSTRELVERAAPDYIVHLAAQSFVAASWQTPAETLITNAISQMNLFEAIRQLGSKARFLVIGSSERVLSFLLSQSTARGIEIRPDPERFRPSDVPVLRGSFEKIERAVGWRPRIPLEQTLGDLLEYWRRRLRPPAH